MANKRRWQPREMRLVSEYLVKHYGMFTCRTRVRLGSVPVELVKPGMDPVELRMAGQWRRWADAVVIKPGQVVIIEAAIKPDPGDVTKLQLYARLFKHTPEFDPFATLPVALELVYALEDPVTLQLAREANIKVVYFKPAWVDEYLATLYPHERRAPLANLEDLT